MSIEKDLELMDDYLANRMNDADRISFEQKLEGDPALKSEFLSQQQFIEGIKKARIAELKGIMNNTPVPGPASGGSALTIKVAAGVILVAIIGYGIYWLSAENGETEPAIVEEISPVTPESTMEITEETPTAELQPEQQAEAPPVAEQEKEVIKPKKKSAVKQPKLEVYDPTKEIREEEQTETIEPVIPGERNEASSLIVETDNSQKKYDFHYQFKEGKLILMGSFDATLYEILEFIADDKRTIFLYYTGKYYLLDESKTKPTPLNPIKDTLLLKKLDTYRGN